jgi:hypothetical protein
VRFRDIPHSKHYALPEALVRPRRPGSTTNNRPPTEEGLSTVESATKHLAEEIKENNPGVLLRKAEAVPTRLDKNQIVWVQSGGAIREEYDYRSVRVFDAPPRNDMVIVAVLTVMEAHPIQPSEG